MRLDARLGALVALPGLLDRVPLDAAVVGEAGVLGGDHRALEVSARCARSRPTAGSTGSGASRPAGARPRSAGRWSTAGRPPTISAMRGEEVQLQRERRTARAASAGAAAPPSAPLIAAAPSSRARSAASTGAVSGRTPRQSAEGLGGLLDQHAQAVAAARAVRRGPGEEALRGRRRTSCRAPARRAPAPRRHRDVARPAGWSRWR